MRAICLSLPEAAVDMPFDDVTEAFRVRGKIFALHLAAQAKSVEVNLKCDPDLAADLRAAYPDIKPGWHMSHRHWNTVAFDGGVPDAKLEWLVRHSWEMVVSGLSSAARKELLSKYAAAKRE